MISRGKRAKQLSSRGVLGLLVGGVLSALPAAAQTEDEFRAKFESEALAIGQTTSERPGDGASTGPDVTVIYLTDVDNYTSGGGSVRAYALGTTSCNVGTEPVAWCDDGGGCGGGMGDEDHPVIGQNLYRLKSGRFEQIGMSWLKHGFVSTNSFDGACGSCKQPPFGGDQLGVGCTDTYGAGLNGSRPLGMRSEVNATTGLFPFPETFVPFPLPIDQRIQVAEADLDPAQNPGAMYWMEGQYVTGDDALEGNGLNNASYRSATVGSLPSLTISLTGSTVREVSALAAWQAADAAVELANAELSGSVPVQRFEAARRVTQSLDGASWHYEIAVRNTNSDRSGRALLVQFPQAVVITNAGTHDIPHHSGEPYSTADWTTTVDADRVRWETEAFAVNENANALRWATMFSFWFDADAPPDDVLWRLELFKPGLPTTVDIPFPGAGGLLFEDDFETGDTGEWDQTVN